MSCIFAITISCFLFIVIMLSLPDLLFQTYENFFSQDLGNNEKIFILTTIPYVELLSRCPFVDGVLIDRRMSRWNIFYLLKLKI